ncbi:hypothetical protein NOR53_3149 [gamma proteobacterium NOR5-3]|nr:hypothetical protein NOR53_3149 [gamma proteobacterium NOR5-3]
MEASTTHCRNCDALIDGQYCKSCGQREGRGDLHFAEAAKDILGDVFTWDSRVWRTLFPLLFRPGFLSAEFNAGRRMRYMPPFRLYIVVSFLMFLMISLTAGDAVVSGEWNEESTESVVTLGVDVDVDASIAAEAGSDASDQDQVTINLMEDGPAWVQALEKRMEANAQRVKEDPREYVDDLLEHLPQVMFVMLPLFALLLKLAYFFSPYHYLQHLVFALHYHTFVYLLFLISSAIEAVSWNIDGLFSIVLIVYLPLALHRCYGSSWGAAIGKSLALLLSYTIALFIGMVAAAIAVLAAM